MMQFFSVKQSSSFILAVVLAALLFSSTVRSVPDPLQLSSGQSQDLCPPSDPDACPINCFRPDPVCGSDGVTYWCGCPDAHCGGVRVVKMGVCDVGNGGTSPAGQALLLVHIVWLILLGVLVLFGLF